ncbi:helix-turn-helix domain protein [Brucella rhizosphaerae]|uniref:Helix-turn-helix domain protein n=2 Tax=Brucella rhizosphaerae TaxID=571254 RepID=A0A256FBH0_9HYPH|nr:helix-turn-helix domain protein [Brucella rhizosphaerae]
MTVKEVATYLSVSISKVWRLGKYDIDFPKPVHISGSTRWDRHSIDSYLDRLQTVAHSGK